MEKRDLWYSPCDYNRVRVIERLADVVTEHGGRVKIEPKDVDVFIHARRLTTLKAENEKTPVIHSRFCSQYGIGTGSVHFVIDNTLYRFEFRDNPFMPDFYSKIKLNENGEYIGRYFGMELSKDTETKKYFIDPLWGFCATEEDIDWVAETIFEMLLSAKPSERIRETKRVRVPNTYDDSFHYETMMSSEDCKLHKVEF